jgi:hypothetical protein
MVLDTVVGPKVKPKRIAIVGPPAHQKSFRVNQLACLPTDGEWGTYPLDNRVRSNRTDFVTAFVTVLIANNTPGVYQMGVSLCTAEAYHARTGVAMNKVALPTLDGIALEIGFYLLLFFFLLLDLTHCLRRHHYTIYSC